ncbi:MAG: phage portal protein [Holosporales bacterium]
MGNHKLWWQKFFAPQQKASQVSAMVACGQVGRAVHTPRQFEALVQEGYQKNVIVYRAVNLIARGIASVPWRLYDKNTEISEHPMLRLLQQPNPTQAGSSLIESLASYWLLSGNSYLECVENGADLPAELYVLRPDRVKLVPGHQGQVLAYEYSVGGRMRRLNVNPMTGRSPVMQLKFFHPMNDWYGMSPLEAAALSIDQHNAVVSHNLSLIQNGGRPSGALIVGKGGKQTYLTQEEREELQQSVKSLYEGGKNAGRIMVMEGDLEWREMGLSPKDMDFSEGRNLSAREIAQAFGVPPMLVGVPGDATFANYREARFHLWEDTILPLVDHLTDELNLWLVPRFGRDLKLSYDIEGIPALAPRREEAWAKLNAASFLTVNEKRSAVGYGPLVSGDEDKAQGDTHAR